MNCRLKNKVSSLGIMIETIYHVNLKQQKLLHHKFLLKMNSHKIAPKCDGWNKTWRFHMQKAVPNPWDAKVPTQLNLFLWNTCCLYISINKSETCFYNRTKLFDWAWQSKGFILLKTVCYYRYIRWEKAVNQKVQDIQDAIQNVHLPVFSSLTGTLRPI